MNKPERLELEETKKAALSAAYDAGHDFVTRFSVGTSQTFDAAVTALKTAKAALATYDANKVTDHKVRCTVNPARSGQSQ